MLIEIQVAIARLRRAPQLFAIVAKSFSLLEAALLASLLELKNTNLELKNTNLKTECKLNCATNYRFRNVFMQGIVQVLVN